MARHLVEIIIVFSTVILPIINFVILIKLLKDRGEK